MNNKMSTEKINQMINDCKTDKDFKEKIMSQKFISDDFTVYLNKLLEERKRTLSSYTGKEISWLGGKEISQSHLYFIGSGERKASRDSLIKIGVTIGCNLDEMNRLLKLAGYSELYAKKNNEQIIIYGLKNGLSVEQINELLEERDCQFD